MSKLLRIHRVAVLRLITQLFLLCRLMLSMRTIIIAAGGAFVVTVAPTTIAAEVSWTETALPENGSAVTNSTGTQVSGDPGDSRSDISLPVERRFVDSIKELLRNHPALLALESEKQAFLERSRAVLAWPDPVVSLGINNISISSPSFDEFLPTNKLIGFRQEFPNLKGRSAKADQATSMSNAIDFMIAAKRESLVADVLDHLIQKRRIVHQVELARDRLQKYNELTEVVESEIEAGNPSLFRLPEIDAERARVSGLINNLNAQMFEHDAQLIALTGTVPSLEVPTLQASDWSGDYLDFHVVRIAQAELASVSESLNIADAARFKRWGVQLSYQQRESSDTFKGDDWVSGQVFFTAPLWYRQSQAPEQRAAEASIEAAKQKMLLAQRSALAEHTALTSRMEAAVENVALLKQEMSAVQDKIETQMTSYEAGTGYFAPIVDGDIALLKLRAQIVAENAAVETNRARLISLLVGTETHE